MLLVERQVTGHGLRLRANLIASRSHVPLPHLPRPERAQLLCSTLAHLSERLSFVVAQLVCTMSFEFDDDLELYPHVELELRAESRRSSREATVRRSAAASRVLVVGLSEPPLERLGPYDATVRHVGRRESP